MRNMILAAAGMALLATASAQADNLRRTGEVWRDLLNESGRAELDIGGLFIDFGTVDQHKYTRGGWRTGWGASAREGDLTYARVDGPRALASFMLDESTHAITIRTRAHARAQRVALELDGRSLTPILGSAVIDRSWREISFAVPDGRGAPGRHRLELIVAEQRGTAADLDWLWIRTDPNVQPPTPTTRVQPMRYAGRPLRALAAPTPRTYSFYLHVPRGGVLSFDYGAAANTNFIVAVQTMRGAHKELFRARAQAGSWRSASVDLSPYAGRAVRLQLTTQGASADAGWGRPELLVPGKRARPRRVRKADRPRNVVLVVYDTTRADVFRPYAKRGSEDAVATPRFDALARSATTFPRAYNNESWTRPSTISILTGLYPESHGALYATDILDSRVETLAEKLKHHGFQTFGIVGNGVLRARFGLGQGWDDYRNYGQKDNSARRIYGEAGDWVEKHHGGKPFLVYIQSHDSHTPYKVDKAYTKQYYSKKYSGYLGRSVSGEEQTAINDGKRRARADDMAWMRALYNGEATYQDEYFGKFIDRLAALGVLDDTLIVVTNDHGEELGEHGQLGHAWTLHDELLQAPLLIRHPKLFPAGRQVKEVVEHVDLAPTIVDALGLPPMKHADGLSMMPLFTGRGNRPRPYYAVSALRAQKRSIHVGRWKLIVDREKGWENLYDIQADPGERKNRMGDRPLAGRLCEVYLGEALAAPTKAQRMNNMAVKRRYRTNKLKLDSKTRRELEALGYLGTEALIADDDER